MPVLDPVSAARLRLPLVALVALAARRSRVARRPMRARPIPPRREAPTRTRSPRGPAATSDDAARGPDAGPPSDTDVDAKAGDDAFDAPPRPANQVLLDGGAYIMALTDGTDTFDFVIVADATDGSNPLNALHAGWSLVAPPDPTFAVHVNTAQSYPVCGYADGLDPAFSPCFGPGTTNVVDIHTRPRPEGRPAGRGRGTRSASCAACSASRSTAP